MTNVGNINQLHPLCIKEQKKQLNVSIFKSKTWFSLILKKPTVAKF